ncbi:glutamine amidotransferase class-I (plasmid) [Nostoc carneum NIES-2107]|nr:glutamine amidotransferase class-I [Nostoc carneum NIES-2107]
MRTILVIIHHPTSKTGLVGQLLHRKGYILDIRCPSLQEELPATLERYDAVVMFGGYMSVNDDETFPFIRTELDWLPTVLDAKKPFLGICLGAQMLARVLGAKVAPHRDHLTEIGYCPVMPTLAGQICFEKTMYFYNWHQEGFDLPSSAVLLASGDQFPNQAFRYGESAYGFQFHPETTQQLIRRWTTLGADYLTLPGVQSYTMQLKLHAQYKASNRHWLQGFLNKWLEPATSIAAAA